MRGSKMRVYIRRALRNGRKGMGNDMFIFSFLSNKQLFEKNQDRLTVSGI